jgi:hypothetical protein
MIKNIDIEYKNYSPDELAIYLKNIINYGNINIIYDSTKFIYIITANQNFTLDFSLSNFSNIFNMKKNIYYSNNNSFSTNLINFNEPMQFFINIKEIEGNIMNNNNINFICNFDIERGAVINFSIIHIMNKLIILIEKNII